MWQDPYDRMAKMAPVGGDGYGLYGDDEGLYLGPGIALVKRQVDAEGIAHFAVRPQEELDVLLHAAYGMEVDLSRRMSILAAVANALQKGEWSRAMISAAHLQLPPLPDDAAVTRLRGVDQLLKYNFNPDEPRDWHGRWTYVPGWAEDHGSQEKDKGVQVAFAENVGNVTDAQVDAPPSAPHRYPPLHIDIPGRKLTPKERASILDNVSTTDERNEDIDRVLGNEGGVSQDSTDKGGDTFFGITAVAVSDYNRIIALDKNEKLEALRLEDVSPENLVSAVQAEFPNLSHKEAMAYAYQRAKDKAKTIYDAQARYYKVDRIQYKPLRQQMLDMIVNPSPKRSIEMLQRVINAGRKKEHQIKVDGKLGPETRNILNQLYRNGDMKTLKDINNKLVAARIKFYQNVPNDNKDKNGVGYRDVHIKGWESRARRFLVR